VVGEGEGVEKTGSFERERGLYTWTVQLGLRWLVIEESERERGREGLGPVLLSRREWLTCTVFCTYLSKIPLSLSASFAFV
jgi:hypothetical protein